MDGHSTFFLKAFQKSFICRKPHRTWCSETDGQKNVSPLWSHWSMRNLSLTTFPQWFQNLNWVAFEFSIALQVILKYRILIENSKWKNIFREIVGVDCWNATTQIDWSYCAPPRFFDKRKMHWQVVNNFGVTTCHHLSLRSSTEKSKFLRGNYQLGSVRTRSNGSKTATTLRAAQASSRKQVCGVALLS